MTKAFVPIIALLLGVLTLALFAAEQKTTAHEIFDITPKAAPYVHEINGDVAITFVHDLDTKHFTFSAVATLTDGTTLGNWNHFSKPAPKGVPLLVHAEDSAADPAITTITFHGLPPANVKSIKVFADFDGDERPGISIELPASFGKPPAKPAAVTLTFDTKAAHPSVRTSTGLKIESSGGPCHFKSSGRVDLEAHLSNATATDSHGDILLKAEYIDVVADAKSAATAPAPKK